MQHYFIRSDYDTKIYTEGSIYKTFHSITKCAEFLFVNYTVRNRTTTNKSIFYNNKDYKKLI